MIKILCFLILIFLSSFASAATKYKVLDLGTLNTETSRATSINDKGEVCGTYTINETTYLFIWRPNLGINFTGIPVNLCNPIVNNNGNVVGTNATYQKKTFNLFTVNIKNEVKNLVTENSEGILLKAFNDRDQILFSKNSSVYLLDGTNIRNLGTLFSPLSLKLNNQGEILGTAYSLKSNQIARYYNLENKRTYDIGEKGYVRGIDINDNGICLISYFFGNQFIFFTWTPNKGVITNFHLPLGEYPKKINNLNQIIVGAFSFLNEDMQFVNLNKILNMEFDWNSPFEKISCIDDLNNKGQMVGCALVKGKQHAVLITPIN